MIISNIFELFAKCFSLSTAKSIYILAMATAKRWYSVLTTHVYQMVHWYTFCVSIWILLLGRPGARASHSISSLSCLKVQWERLCRVIHRAFLVTSHLVSATAAFTTSRHRCLRNSCRFYWTVTKPNRIRYVVCRCPNFVTFKHHYSNFCCSTKR